MRLTNKIRDEIVTAAMAGAFSKTKQKLEKRRFALGDRVYRLIVGKHGDAMLAMPRAFFEYRSNCHLSISGYSHRVEWGDLRPLPDSGYYHHDNKPIADALAKLQTDQDALKANESKLRADIRGLVASVNTDKQLLEVWPEAAPFIPKQNKPQAKALAIQPDQLNAVLKKVKAA